MNWQKFAPILYKKCLYVARTGRPDILWSVIKQARSVTKWTQACDRRLARLISYIHYASGYRQYCHVGNAAQHCLLGLFQDSDFAGDLEILKSRSGGVLCIFGSRTFVPISWMCKKQTSVSHSSTASEIILLDAGLHMDGLPALDLWDLVIEILGTTTKLPKSIQACMRETDANIHNTPKDHNMDLSNVDQVHSNAHRSKKITVVHFRRQRSCDKDDHQRQKPDDETCIPDVSRTHRVALHWLFDRINLDLKVQIKYVKSKNQLADIPSRVNFTRDEWYNLLHLFNIMNDTTFSCCHFSNSHSFLSAGKRSEMSKRTQESSSPGSPTAKAKACCLVSCESVLTGQVYSSNLKNPGVRETLKCAHGKKEIQIRMVFCSACLGKVRYHEKDDRRKFRN